MAYCGEQGVHAVAAHRRHVVLLAVGMQPLDGHEACRCLRLSLGPEVMIVALTGWGQLQDKDKAAAPAAPAKLRTLLARCH